MKRSRFRAAGAVVERAALSRSALPHGLMLVVVMGLACGGAPPEPEAPPSGDTSAQPRFRLPAICDPEPAAPDGPDAVLDAAKDAVSRGCPREALTLVASLGPIGELSEARGARAYLLALEAETDAATAGLSPLSGMVGGFDEPWIVRVTEGTPAPARVAVAARFVRAGLLPQSVWRTGRLARLVVRVFGDDGCPVQGESRGTQMRRQLIHRELRRSLAPRNAAGLREAGRMSLFECRIEDALAGFRQAAGKYREAGEPELALASELDALEVAAFPGHRADRFGMPDLEHMGMRSVEHGLEVAALGEAGAAGAGPFAERAEFFDGALSELLSAHGGAPSAANASRVASLRAIASFLFEQDAERALRRGDEAIERAAEARRADLLTPAVFIRLVALADLGRARQAKETGAAYEELVARRGAPGARGVSARLVSMLAAAYTRRGRGHAAADLSSAARPLALSLPPEAAVELLTGISLALTTTGRLTEALEEIRRLERYWEQQRAGVSEMLWESYDAKIDGQRGMVEALLGVPPDPADLAGTTPQLRRFEELVEQGDSVALRREVLAAGQRGDQALLEGLVTTLALLQQCEPIADLLLPYALDLRDRMSQAIELHERRGGTKEQREAAAAFLVAMRGSGMATLPPLAVCGAMLGQERVVTVVKNVVMRLTGGMSMVESRTEAQRAEARREWARAATLYERSADEFDEVSGLSARGGIGASQMRGYMVSRAVVAHLEAGRPADAVRVLEENHGRDLRVARQRARPQGDEYGAYVAAERRVSDAQKRVRAVARLARGADDAEVARALRDRVDALQREVERRQRERLEAERRLRARSDAAYRASALAPVAGASQLASRLRDEETLLYYHLQPDRSWAIVVDRSGAKGVRLNAGFGSPRSLFPTLNRYRRALEGTIASGGRGLSLTGGRGGGGLQSAQRAVYDALVAPLLSSIPEGRRVLVVPDEHTAQLPLAALGPPGEPWGARNPLRVLPGGFVLPERPGARPSTGSALVAGDPAFDPSEGERRGSAGATAATASWKRLPGTRAEARQVARMLDAEPLLGSDATEEAIRARAPEAGVVHLATHGLANELRPSRSALVFSATDRGDGILHAYEVKHLPLQADLVVLSACETGVGQRRGMEGVLALDRAFLVAGAKAVVSSLWVVDDESTAALMSAMYRELAEGRPLDVALARAQATVRERRPHPYFWSGFQVVGAGWR